MFCFLNLLLLVPALNVTTDHEAVEGVGDDVDAGGGGKHHGPGREGEVVTGVGSNNGSSGVCSDTS